MLVPNSNMASACVKGLPEPLLDENPDRYCMFPIKYPQIWEFYKKAEASFWTGKRLNFAAFKHTRCAPTAPCRP